MSRVEIAAYAAAGAFGIALFGAERLRQRYEEALLALMGAPDEPSRLAQVLESGRAFYGAIEPDLNACERNVRADIESRLGRRVS